MQLLQPQLLQLLQLLQPQLLLLQPHEFVFDKDSNKSSKKFVFVFKSVLVAFAMVDNNSMYKIFCEKFIFPPFNFSLFYFSPKFVKSLQINR